MMGALKLLQYENYISTVANELSCASFLGEKKLNYIKYFLDVSKILSLADVTLTDVSKFFEFIYNMAELTDTQKTSYASALETAVRVFYESREPEILSEIAACSLNKNLASKVTFFLLINHINRIEEIDGSLRLAYEKYLTLTVKKKAVEYTKALDHVKLHSIENSRHDFRPRELKYSNDVIYLAYHPNFEIAKSYYYTQVKEPLFFDFSLPASPVLKGQIFSHLKYVVEELRDLANHHRIQTYITPLWNLYRFCYENGIEDLTQITYTETLRFKEYLTQPTMPKCDTAFQVIARIRKFLFLTSSSINWEANVWYLERFSFTGGRMNPSNPTEAFYFDDIALTENAMLFKSYIKYLLGLSQRLSITSIYGLYNAIGNFLGYLDKRKLKIESLTKSDLESYINSIFAENTKGEAANRKIGALAKFFDFLETRELIVPLGFHFEYFKAKITYNHNDISVSKEEVDLVFSVLDKFPEHLRLMYLNLWCIGLRINEVCTIKSNAYLFDGTTAWFQIYQNKARGEKRVPIPYELYEIMTSYIKRNGIGADEYVFQSSKPGQPYKSGTFRKQIKNLLDKYGVSETYHFRSHGYRHTLATELYISGSNMQSIREYLGHTDIEMTKQYVDHLPNLIDKANEEYFRRKANETLF